MAKDIEYMRRYKARRKQEPIEKQFSAPELDKDLIQRANSAGTFIDYGDAGVREYNRLQSEISEMDMTYDERRQAITQLHSLMTAQLEAESKAFTPYSAGVGPARFDKKKMDRAHDRAAEARADVTAFMDGLKKQQKKKASEKRQKLLSEAMQKALAEGALEFTVNGETWKRKTKRSRSFYSD